MDKRSQLTSKDIRKAINTMRKLDLAGPFVVYAPTRLLSGQLGSLYGVKFIDSVEERAKWIDDFERRIK